MPAATLKALVVLVLLSSGLALAQSAQDAIELDKELALAKRRAELADLKKKAEPAPSSVSSRPLIAQEIKPVAEEQFLVRAIYGPTNALRALVAYRDTLPVELSMRPGTSTAAAAPSPSPMSGNQPYAPSALPSTVMPILAPRPEATR